jgi:hypothetical protein
MSTDSHLYRTLNAELREIRLLTLLPGSHDEPLQCLLSTVSLGAAEYNALSYVWGAPVNDSSTPTEILLDGNRFPTTPNLHSALWHLRPLRDSHAICLWVDAVCINQNDMDERSQQVAMMRDIYSTATQVTIWLGEDDDDSNTAFDALLTITGSEPWPQDDASCSNIRRCSGTFFFYLTNRCPWLSRVWILQELALSKNDPIVVCGHKRTLWSTFIAAWQTIAKEAFADWGKYKKKSRADDDGTIHEDDVGVTTLMKLDVLDDMRQAVQQRGGDSLKKLLYVSRTSAATDPRDRIYGLLGLLEQDAIDPESSVTIPVDYRKPCSEVYADATAHFFSRGEGPYFLSGVCLSGGPSAAPQIPSLPKTVEQPELPSWVPDFTRQEPDKTTQPDGFYFHPPATMHASGAGQGAKNGIVLSDGRTLKVEGLIVDRLADVTPFGSSLGTLKSDLVRLDALAAEAKQRPCSFETPIAPLMQGFRESEPLWRILISNKHQKSGYEPAPPSYEAMYLDLVDNQDTSDSENSAHEAPNASEYEDSLRSYVGRKSFFTTTNGFIGTCVPASRAGDVAAIIFGSPSPFILRPVAGNENEEQSYWLIGSAYVGGIMDGEMVDQLYCEDLMDSTTFLIR